MRKLHWTNGHVTMIAIICLGMGVGVARLIDAVHQEAVGTAEVVGFLVAVALLVAIVRDAARIRRA